jgi:hypothetical protein
MDIEIQREEFNQIIADRRVDLFRKFVDNNIEQFPDGFQTKIVTMSDSSLMDIMLTWTAIKPEFGKLNPLSRDIIRTKDLESNLSLSTADLVDFIKQNENYPSCMDCEWFRNSPSAEEKACMHLGAMPFDICCPGWTRLNDVQRSDSQSST